LYRRLVGPRTGLDGVERRKALPYRDSNSNVSVVLPVEKKQKTQTTKL
jgi:hypothetical protein